MYYGWMMRPKVVCHPFNTPAVRYVTVVIPAKADKNPDYKYHKIMEQFF